MINDDRNSEPAAGRRHHHPEGSDGATLAGPPLRDPVCGMAVDPATAVHTEHEGRRFFFCSSGCKAKFVADPHRYASSAGQNDALSADDRPHTRPHPHGNPANQKAASASMDVIWTCPMHPEIRRAAPGSCPICGMALEPLVATAELGPSPELEVGMGKVGMPLRVAVTGAGQSPALDVTVHAIGKTRSIERINKALDFIAERENQQ